MAFDRSVAPLALVVDDNPVIRLHAADIFEDSSFSVFAASGSDEGLAWLEQHGDKIVLLFTNVEIPGPMNGFALARHTAERWPAVGILVSSGRFDPGPGDMPDGAVFIPKPFSTEQVLAATRTVLAAKQPELLETANLVW